MSINSYITIHTNGVMPEATMSDHGDFAVLSFTVGTFDEGRQDYSFHFENIEQIKELLANIEFIDAR